jgi:hypothetical protein
MRGIDSNKSLSLEKSTSLGNEIAELFIGEFEMFLGLRTAIYYVEHMEKAKAY